MVESNLPRQFNQGGKMIVAKPVIDKQFWILKQDNEKIGNVEACHDGYRVKMNNSVQNFKTIKMLQQRTNIHFETAPHKIKPNQHSVHGYVTATKAYNPVWDVVNHLPLYTKTKKSKSWFAAGWYSVKRGKSWKAHHDPKLIVLERYPFKGPFHDKDTAERHTND